MKLAAVETRLELSAICHLASYLARSCRHATQEWTVYQLKCHVTLHSTIFTMWPSDSLWDRCLLTAKFWSAFCFSFVATCYVRRPRWAADHKSAARRLHSPHICDTKLPAAHRDFSKYLLICSITKLYYYPSTLDRVISKITNNWETIFYGHYRSIFNHCDIISL